MLILSILVAFVLFALSFSTCDSNCRTIMENFQRRFRSLQQQRFQEERKFLKFQGPFSKNSICTFQQCTECLIPFQIAPFRNVPCFAQSQQAFIIILIFFLLLKLLLWYYYYIIEIIISITSLLLNHNSSRLYYC